MNRILQCSPLLASIACGPVLIEQDCTEEQQEFWGTSLQTILSLRSRVFSEIKNQSIPFEADHSPSEVMEDLNDADYNCAVNKGEIANIAGWADFRSDSYLLAVDTLEFSSAQNTFSDAAWLLEMSPEEIRSEYIATNGLDENGDYSHPMPGINQPILSELYRLGGSMGFGAEVHCHEQAHLTWRVEHEGDLSEDLYSLNWIERAYLGDSAYSMGAACVFPVQKHFTHLMWYAASGNEDYLNPDTELPYPQIN